MPIEIISEIVCKNAQSFVLLDDNSLRGSYRIVALISNRDNITSDHKKAGMVCFVQETGIEYELQSDLTTWNEKVATNSIETNFSWGDATPFTIYVIGCVTTINSVMLSIDEEFDGVGTQIKVGDSVISDSLMTVLQNDPTDTSVFSTSPFKSYTGGEHILLTIILGAGASKGHGRIKLVF